MRSLTRSDKAALAVVAVSFAAAYAACGLIRHWHFDSAFDLGIFDQAIWHLSRFETPASTVSGFANILGDHFYPIMGAFAPLYWLVPSPGTLIVAQAVLLAASIVPVFLFARDRLPRGPALALAVAYGLFWGMQRTAMSDVHEMAFAPLFIATLLVAVDRRRWRLFWLTACALALVKEDLIALLVWLGIFLFARGERRRGALLFGLSLVALVLVVSVLVPLASNSGDYYGYMGAYRSVLNRPWTILTELVTPAAKLRTALLWFAPFVFLPLASPLSALLVPLVFSRLLSASPNHWGAGYHYTAPLAPILAMSAADALSRIARRFDEKTRPRLFAGLAASAIGLSAVLPGHQPLWRVLTPAHYPLTAVQRTGYAALRLIPAGASVVAQAAIVPHLSEREHIYMLVANAPDADFLVASTELSSWPLADRNELMNLIAERRARAGYSVVFDENSWVVLHREGAR